MFNYESSVRSQWYLWQFFKSDWGIKVTLIHIRFRRQWIDRQEVRVSYWLELNFKIPIWIKVGATEQTWIINCDKLISNHQKWIEFNSKKYHREIDIFVYRLWKPNEIYHGNHLRKVQMKLRLFNVILSMENITMYRLQAYQLR